MSTRYAYRWYMNTTNTMSSRKHDMRCSVGILMMNAKRSSMKVLSALYIKNFQLRWATDLRRYCTQPGKSGRCNVSRQGEVRRASRWRADSVARAPAIIWLVGDQSDDASTAAQASKAQAIAGGCRQVQADACRFTRVRANAGGEQKRTGGNQKGIRRALDGSHVDKELRCHDDEAAAIHERHQGLDQPSVPASVVAGVQRVAGVADDEQ
mmetsp:Transcript_29584/g.76406  ORF Transcript_29584/g.76406 Transcript_29584/m.76406 type:complete len:210 (+) Transcript_29584:311-940(+)